MIRNYVVGSVCAVEIDQTYIAKIEKHLRLGDRRKPTSWRYERKLGLGDRKKPTSWRYKKGYVVEMDKNLRRGDKKTMSWR
jgi:hypothetical protein